MFTTFSTLFNNLRDKQIISEVTEIQRNFHKLFKIFLAFSILFNDL